MNKILVVFGRAIDETAINSVKAELGMCGDCVAALTGALLLKTEKSTNDISNMVDKIIPAQSAHIVCEFAGLAGNNLLQEANEWFIRDRQK